MQKRPRRAAVWLFAALHAAFGDFQATIHLQVAERGKVATRKTLHGVHRGEFMAVPPTGKQVAFDVTDILYIEGKITDHWNAVDLLGLMQLLGAVPQPEQSGA